MASIAGYSVTVFDPENGMLQPARPKMATLDTASGVDGNAVSRGGWANRPQRVRTAVTITGSISTATALIQSYRTLLGTQVALTDQFGISFSNVTVLDLVARPAATGFTNEWRIEAFWTLLPDTARP